MQLSFCLCSQYKSHNKKKLLILKFCLIPSVVTAWQHQMTLLFAMPHLAPRQAHHGIMEKQRQPGHVCTFSALWGLGRSSCMQNHQPQRLFGVNMGPYIRKYGDSSNSLNFHRRLPEDTSFHTVFLMLGSISLVFLATWQPESSPWSPWRVGQNGSWLSK